MAQLAIAAAGAAIGSAFGPVGTQVGWVVGSMIGAQFGPKQKSEGPRLQDLKVTGSEYGQTIPWAAGHPRVAGQVWWSSQRREIATTTSTGKGSGGAENTSYTYEVDILYGLVNRDILYVSRIWLNGKLVWTAHVDSTEDSITNSNIVPEWTRMTVYTGASNQLPDPVYEAAKGVGSTPANRGRGTVFIEGLQLGNSGVIPNLTFEVVIAGTLSTSDLGFLSQWEVMTDSTHVEATLGPDPVLSGTSVLQATQKKWGPQAIHVPAGGGTTSTPATVQSRITGKSWRFEFWVQWTGGTGAVDCIKLENSLNGQGVAIGRNGSIGAYYASIASSISGASGVFGVVGDIPPINTWIHVAVEQVVGQTVKVYDSNVGGEVFELTPVLHVFSDNLMNQVTLNSSANDYYVDSMLFRWFDASEQNLLYGVSGYSVPTGPFEPPPYTYSIVDPDEHTLQEVVEDLCELAGMPAGTYDATALAAVTKPVRGFVLSQVATIRSAIEQLATTYFFEAYVTDKLYFVPRGGSVAVAISESDLGTGIDNADEETLPTNVGSEAEIPAQFSLTYSNVFSDYNAATEHSDRLISGQVSTSAVQLPFTFTSAEAKGIADAMVLDAYASRVSGTMSVPLSYAQRTPTDVVTVPDADGNTYRVRFVRRTDGGPLLKFDWVLDDATAIESAGITSEDYTPVVDVTLPAGTVIELLDIPLLTDNENKLGHYVAATSSGVTWPGASINRSSDNVEYTEAARVNERAIIGTATTILGNWTGGVVFDETNSVTVTLLDGTLSNSTKSAMLLDNTINAMMVGQELIRFNTVTLVATDIYTLSGLLRGCSGTEWAMSNHVVNEPIVLLRSAGLRYVAIDLPSLEAERFYKGVTLGRSLASVTSESFTCEGVSLKPFAPVDVRKSVDSINNITLTWKRRTRLASTFVGTTGSVVPIGELSESYSVDVVVASVVVRTITATSQTCTYTAAQQTEDGVIGATSLRFDVYQVSAVVGRGYAGSLSTTGAVTPMPQISTLTVGGSFASGAALYATVGGVTYNYTSVGGDTDLAGIATSFASVIDAAAAYTATAGSGVVTVTGPTSVAFPVVAGVSAGDNTTTWNLTQTASATVAGVSNELTFTWKNLADPAGTNAYPLGMTFYATIQRISPSLNITLSYVSTPSGRTNYEVLPIVASQIYGSFVSAGLAATYGLGMTISDILNSTLSLFTPSSEPYNWTIQAVTNQVKVSGLVGDTASGVTPATLRPQIVTLTLAGTPATGRVYRATLGGVNLDYTATGGDTTMSLVATGLAAVIDVEANYLASAVGAVITITHASNNVAFTYSSTVIGNTVTLTAATTQEAA